MTERPSPERSAAIREALKGGTGPKVDAALGEMLAELEALRRAFEDERNRSTTIEALATRLEQAREALHEIARVALAALQEAPPNGEAT